MARIDREIADRLQTRLTQGESQPHKFGLQRLAPPGPHPCPAP